MDHYPVDRVDRIVLAGAFGSHIDVKYAMVLGLIPDCPLDHVRSAGNGAGTGARIALLNAAAHREIGDVVRRIVKVETALQPRFQEHFVAAMALPHKTDAFPHLAKVVVLPAQAEIGARAAKEKGSRSMPENLDISSHVAYSIPMNQHFPKTTTAAEGLPRRRFTVAELEAMVAAGIPR